MYNFETSETATRNPFASAQGKKAVSECAQEHAPHFSGAVLDRSNRLIKILKKLLKKDRVRYEATMKKIQEVINSEDPNHYKNLSYDLSDFKGVYIDTHFVLIFKIDNTTKVIKFEDLKDHDEAYQR